MRAAAGKGRVTVGAVLLHLLPAILVCGIFAGVGIVHVTSRVMVVGVGYSLSKLEAENRELVRENDRLKLELATLKSPLRLEKVAREQLGMIPPPPGSVIPLGEQKKQIRVEKKEDGKQVVAAKGRVDSSSDRRPSTLGSQGDR